MGPGARARVGGGGWGTGAAVLGGLKGCFPVWIARKAGLGLGAAGLAGLAAVIGHNWSIWLRGRSGRGMATSAGVLLGIDPALLVWTIGWSIAGWKVGSGLGGFLGWGLLPIVAVALGRPPTESLLLLLLTVVLMARRAQGNPDSSLGRGPALRRGIHDNDQFDEGFPDRVADPRPPRPPIGSFGSPASQRSSTSVSPTGLSPTSRFRR